MKGRSNKGDGERRKELRKKKEEKNGRGRERVEERRKCDVSQCESIICYIYRLNYITILPTSRSITNRNMWTVCMEAWTANLCVR